MQQIIDVRPSSVIVIATVLALHIADEYVKDAERCYIDSSRFNVIGRMESPGWYSNLGNRFVMPQPTLEEWESQQNGRQRHE